MLVFGAAEIDANDFGSSHNAAIIRRAARICKVRVSPGGAAICIPRRDDAGWMTGAQKPGRMAAIRNSGSRPIARKLPSADAARSQERK